MSNYSVRTGNMFAQIGGATAPIKKVKGEGKTASAQKRAKKKAAAAAAESASSAALPIGNGLAIPSAAPLSASDLRGAYQAVTEDLAPEDDIGFEDIKRRERKEKDSSATAVDEPKKSKKIVNNRKDRPDTNGSNGNGNGMNGESKRAPKSALKGVSSLVKQMFEDPSNDYSIDELIAGEAAVKASDKPLLNGTTLLAAVQDARMAILLGQANKSSSSSASSTATSTRGASSNDDNAPRSARAPLSARAPILGSNSAASLSSVDEPVAVTTPPPATSSSDSKRSSRAPKSSSSAAAPTSAAAPVPSFVAPTIESVAWKAELAAERDNDAIPSIQSFDQKSIMWDPQSADSTELLDFWALQLERSAKNDNAFINQFVLSNALETLVSRLYTNLWLPTKSVGPKKIHSAMMRIFAHTIPGSSEWHLKFWDLLSGLANLLRNAPSRDQLLQQIIKGVTHQKKARLAQNPLNSLFINDEKARLGGISGNRGGNDGKSGPQFVAPHMDLGLTNVTADFFGDAAGPNSLKSRCDALVQSSVRIESAGTRVNQYSRVLEKQKWQHQLQMDFHLLEKDIQATIDNTTRHLDATNDRSSHVSASLDRNNDNKKNELSAYGGDREFQVKHTELTQRRAQLQAELARVQLELDALIARHERSRTQHDALTQKWQLTTDKLMNELQQYRGQIEQLENDRKAAGAIHHHVVMVYENLTTRLTDTIKRANQQSSKSLADYIVQVREHVLQVHDVYQGLQGRMTYCKEKLDAADAEAKRARALHLPVPSFKESFSTIYSQDTMITRRMEKQVITLFEYVANLVGKADGNQLQSLVSEIDNMIRKLEAKNVAFDLIKLRSAHAALVNLANQHAAVAAVANMNLSSFGTSVVVPLPGHTHTSSTINPYASVGSASSSSSVAVRAPVAAAAAVTVPAKVAATPTIPKGATPAKVATPTVPVVANGRATSAPVPAKVPVKTAAKVATTPVVPTPATTPAVATVPVVAAAAPPAKKSTVFAPIGKQVSNAAAPPIMPRPATAPVVAAVAAAPAPAPVADRQITVPTQKKSWEPAAKPAVIARIPGADSDDEEDTAAAAAPKAAATATPKQKRGKGKQVATPAPATTTTTTATPAATTNEFPSLPAATPAPAAVTTEAPVVAASTSTPVIESKKSEPEAAAAPAEVAAVAVAATKPDVVATTKDDKDANTATKEEPLVTSDNKKDDTSKDETTPATETAEAVDTPAVAADTKEEPATTSDTNGNGNDAEAASVTTDGDADSAAVAAASASPKPKRGNRKSRNKK